MCMKYVNAIIQCFNDKSSGVFSVLNFSSIIESVSSEKKDDKYEIGGFSVAAFINIRGTRNTEIKDNPLNNGQTLNFRIRLTKLSEKPEEQLSYDLKDFTIDLSDSDNLHEACFKYMERIEVVNIDKLLVDKTGKYVLKLLVKDAASELYDVQMLHPIYVK